MDFPQWEEWKPSQSQHLSQQLLGIEEDDNEENQEHRMFHQEKDAILFLIDAHLPMFLDTLSSDASSEKKSAKIDHGSAELSLPNQSLVKEEKKEEDDDDDVTMTKSEHSQKQKKEEGDTKSQQADIPAKPFSYALKAAVQVSCDKIISSPSDLLGVVFYGTKEKNNAFDFENVHVYQQLDVPDANRIKNLEAMAKYEDSFSLGSCDEGIDAPKADFSNALWTCQNLFSTVPSNVGFKRIFLFTSEEDPSNGDGDIRKKCIERASALVESDIVVELFVLRKKTDPLDTKVFWDHIIAYDADEYTGRITTGTIEHFNDLKDIVRRKEFKKRSLATTNLNIGQMEMAVSMYNLVQKSSKNAPIMLDAKTNKPVKSETRLLCEDTATELMPNEVRPYFNYGGEMVFFSKEELMQIRNIGSQGIQILGFKPKSSLKVYHNYRSSSFLYPNDFKIKNSSVAFSALIRKMVEKDRIAIARMCARQSSRLSYVALLPQEEVLDEDGAQMEPPGLHIVYLPFADGIRSYDFPVRKPDPNEEQITSAKRMIKKLSIDFNSHFFENPLIQKHYAALQALALEHNEVEEVKDVVQPDYEGMGKYKAYIENFSDHVYEEDYDPFPRTKKAAASRKRKRDVKSEVKDENDAQPRKKKKSASKAKQDSSEGPIDMVKEVKEGTAKRFTNAVLKKFLKNYNQPVSGKKEDLLNRIEDYLRSRGKID